MPIILRWSRMATNWLRLATERRANGRARHAPGWPRAFYHERILRLLRLGACSWQYARCVIPSMRFFRRCLGTVTHIATGARHGIIPRHAPDFGLCCAIPKQHAFSSNLRPTDQRIGAVAEKEACRSAQRPKRRIQLAHRRG